MIIGLCGKAGSGKDTVADFLVRDHGFVKVALADPLKRIARDVFDFSDKQLWGPSEMRNAPDIRYPRAWRDVEESRSPAGGVLPAGKIATEFLTPRHALQQLGTEWGRHCYPNVWVDYALRIAKALHSNDPIIRPTYSAQRGLDYADCNTAGRKPGNGGSVHGVVISDVRFRNEVDAIRVVGGVVWKIVRPGQGLEGKAGQHVSETEQNSIPDEMFQCIFENTSTLEALAAHVKIAAGTLQ